MEQEDGIIINILSAIGILSILGLIFYFAPIVLVPILILVFASLSSKSNCYYDSGYEYQEQPKHTPISNVKEWLLEYKLKNYGLSKKYIYASNLNEARAMAINDPTVERILHLRQIG